MWQSQGAAYSEECPKLNIEASECRLSEKLLSDFRNANAFWLTTICIIFMISNVIRAIRWKMMFASIDYQITTLNSFFGVMIAYFTNLGLPRAGEFVRAGVISKYEGIPYEKAFGTIVLGRIVDFICLFVMLLLGFLFHFNVLWNYLVDNLKIPTNLLFIGGGIMAAGMIFIFWYWKKLNDREESNLPSFVKKVQGIVHGFIEGLGSIRNLSNVWLFIGYSIAIWLCYYLMHYFTYFAYEPVSHLSPMDGLLVFDFSALGIVFPSPGGMGSFHAMVVEALKILGISSLDAFSFAMICFFTLNIFCNVLFGLLSVIFLPIYNKMKSS